MAEYCKLPYLSARIMKIYLSEFPKDRAAEIRAKTLAGYRELVRKVPDIGGKKNPMSSNLYMALGIFALCDASEGDLTPEKLDDVIKRLYPKNVPILSSVADMNKSGMRKAMFSYFSGMSKVTAEKKASGEWNNTWVLEPLPDESGRSVAFNLHGCPIADFAKENGYTEYMPVVCGSDHATAAFMHAKLIRKHTVAEGYDICDYRYVGDKEENTDFG